MTIKTFIKTLRDKCPQANFRVKDQVGLEESDFYFPRNGLLGDPDQAVYVIGADSPQGFISWNVSQYALDKYPLVLIIAFTGYVKGESQDNIISQAKFDGLFV